MYSEEVKSLAIYRLEQAKENLEEAQALFNINKYKGASNRAYYAIFHAIKSILALEETDFYIITKEECKTQIETANQMIVDAEKYISKKLE